MKYNMNLLEKLNNEYKEKALMTNFPKYDHNSQFQYAEQRLKKLSKFLDLQGKKVLEIGCGGGYVSRRLATHFGCEVTGIDIYESTVWEELGREKNLEYKVIDLGQENPFYEKSFDIVISYVAWEHMKHPFKVLQECVKLLKPEGKIYIYANQYRSAMASHVYRTIYFPFPHLLFPNEVVVEYCLNNGVTQEWMDAFYYVNKLTYSHYKEYFRMLNLRMLHEKLYKRKLDMDFYKRFEDKLGLYPIFDLELDFFEIVLCIDDINKRFQERQSLTSFRIQSDKVSPQKNGTIIRWSVQAYGVGLQYAWYIYKNNERTRTVWYSPNNYFDWTPEESGYYQVRVFIKDLLDNKISDLSDEYIIE